jgi:hypothetical protein
MRTCMKLLALVGLAAASTAMRPPGEPLPTCGGETGQSRRIVDRSFGADDLAASRARGGRPTLAPGEVRVLRSDIHVSACRRIREELARDAAVLGGSRQGTHLVIYSAGEYIAAVLSSVPDPAPPPPGHVRVRTGRSALHVVADDDRRIASVAM